MPWLTKKTFLIPALASVLVLSMVGVVSAVQGGVFGPSNQESAEVSLEESESEAVEQPAIGFACVKGTVVCEEVKSILLDTDYEEVLTKWTRQSLIQHLVDTQYVSLVFATEVVDAVRFDWGDGSTYAGGSGSESSTGSGSASSGGSARTQVTPGALVSPSAPGPALPPPSVAPPAGFTADEAAKLLVGQMDDSFAFSKALGIDYLVSIYNIDRDKATVAMNAINVDWNQAALMAGRYLTTREWMSYRSKVGWNNQLTVNYKFTQSQADFALSSLNLDWDQYASRAAIEILEFFECDFFVEEDEIGAYPLIEELVRWVMGSYYFTEDEAFFGAMDQVETEGDWVWKIFPNCVP